MEIAGRPIAGENRPPGPEEPGFEVGPVRVRTIETASPMRVVRRDAGLLFSPFGSLTLAGPFVKIRPEGEGAVLKPDPLGLAAVYYTEDDRGFSFSTSLAPLRGSRELSRDGLSAYLMFGHVPASLTPFEGIRLLSRGESLWLDARGALTVRPGDGKPDAAPSPEGARDGLVELLKEEVSRSLNLTKGPVGLFLSGGIDSAGLLYAIKEATERRVYTYTLAASPRAQEAEAARRISSYFGTVHREIIPGPELFGRAPDVIASLEEPHGNPSALLVDIALERASEEVDAVFSGLGADEIFSGHAKHRALGAWLAAPAVLKSLGRAAAWCYDLLPASLMSSGHFRLARFVRAAGRLGERGAYPWLYTTAHPRWARSKALDEPLGLFPDAKRGFGETDMGLWLAAGPARFTTRLALKRGVVPLFPYTAGRIAALAESLPFRERAGVFCAKRQLREAFSAAVPGKLLGARGRGFTVPVEIWGEAGGLFESALKEPGEVISRAVGRDTVQSLFPAYKDGKTYVFPYLYTLAALRLWLENEGG